MNRTQLIVLNTGRSEGGMLLVFMLQTYVLIGDGSHARLFHVADPNRPWQLVRRVDREHSREKTDRAESHEDRGEHGFAKQLVGELETGRQAGTFDRLVLVAPPKFLGQLRAELSAPLAACVTKSFSADYTHVPDGDLPDHVDLA
jgi:protein required for attachment to host cells